MQSAKAKKQHEKKKGTARTPAGSVLHGSEGTGLVSLALDIADPHSSCTPAAILLVGGRHRIMVFRRPHPQDSRKRRSRNWLLQHTLLPSTSWQAAKHHPAVRRQSPTAPCHVAFRNVVSCVLPICRFLLQITKQMTAANQHCVTGSLVVCTWH